MAKSKHNLGLKEAIIEAIKQKKGHDIVAIDLTDNHQAVADYYIICHGNSSSQVEAITDNIERFARTETSEHPSHIEGQQNALWVLMVFGIFAVYIHLRWKSFFLNPIDVFAFFFPNRKVF